MLKHVALFHKDEHPNDVNFCMQIISQHRTAFERQITEAVLIRKNAGKWLMNSKKEYNRCYIPEILVKKCENDVTKSPFLEAEESALETIRKMQSFWRKRSRKGDHITPEEISPKNGPKRRKIEAKITPIDAEEEKITIKNGINGSNGEIGGAIIEAPRIDSNGLKVTKKFNMKNGLQRLPILLAQVKAGNNSQKLLNEVREIAYNLLRENGITKKVYNVIMKSIS